MKNDFINKSGRQLSLVVLVVGLLIGLGSLYQAEAAPPEPEKKPNSTPRPLTDGAITVEGVTEVLSQPLAASASIQPLAAIMTEGFEGSWPASGWQLIDQSNSDGGQYLWGKRNCHPHTGNFGGWSVGGGTQGSSLSCSANYPNNADTWAVFGPFNLSNATAASLTFHMWGRTEIASGCPFDFFFAGSSINGTSFSGISSCGNFTTGTAGNGYHQRILDLNSRLGQSQVWIAFRLKSDSSITDSGITIDDVTLDVTTGGGSQPPNPPTNLTALALSQTQIFLRWTDNSNNETGFKIEQSPNGVTGWTQVATTPANLTSRLITNLVCGTTYHYRVRAYNASGNSAYSNVDSTQTAPCPGLPIPNAPSSLTATPISTNQIRLEWTDNSNDETGFKIERSPNGVSNWSQIATVGANVETYLNIGLVCDTIYFYRVRAYNTSGNSAYSNDDQATTPCSYDIFLPLVMKSLAAGPAPTPIPTQTPLSELDGNWTGATSQAQPISFTIINRSFTRFTWGYQIGGCGATTTITFGTPQQIVGNTFIIPSSGPSGVTVEINGTFNSNTSASGTISISGTPCGNATATWAATKL